MKLLGKRPHLAMKLINCQLSLDIVVIMGLCGLWIITRIPFMLQYADEPGNYFLPGFQQ